MEPESALEAMNEALGGDSDASAPPSAEAEDTAAGSADDSEGSGAPEGGDPAAEGAESTDSGDGSGESGAAKGESKPDKPAADETSERNPDGTFKKREAKPDEQKLEAARKAADPLNDPIPKDLKKETQERIKTLITTAKEAQAQASQAEENFSVFVNGLQAAGVTPDQYGETLSYLSLFNKALSGDEKAGEAALAVIQEHVEKLSTFLGRDFAVADPLAKHVDLKQAIQQGKLTQDYARELARQRNAQGFRGELTTQASRMTQQQQQEQQERETARNDLNTLEVQLKANDPQYEAKKAMIVPILKPILAQLPASQWRAAFQQAYSQARVAAPRAAAPTIPKNQPLRGNKQPSGGQARAPSSMLEAIDGALGSMRK